MSPYPSSHRSRIGQNMPMLRFDFAQSNQSMLLLLGLLAIFIFVGVVAGRKTRRLPGPPSHSFLLNNSLEVLSNLPRMLDWLLENSLKYGGEGGLGAWTFQVRKNRRRGSVGLIDVLWNDCYALCSRPRPLGRETRSAIHPLSLNFGD